MKSKNLIRLISFIALFSFYGLNAQKIVKGIETANNKIHKLGAKTHYLYDHDTIIVSSDNIYKVENLGQNINSEHAESGARISPDGNSLYFFRIAHPENTGKTRDIWVSHFSEEDSTWSEAEHMGSPINNYGENSVHSVFDDGKSLLLHNRYLKNGDALNGVSASYLQDNGEWTFPEALKIKHYNNDQLCSFHMSNDGTILLLAIHYGDSFGAQDLYVSFREGEKGSLHYSEPKNLGKTINTEKVEATVFLAEDDSTIYYSTNGKDGIGGFDIFKSVRKDSTWTNWTTPENMGIPYNTPDHEFYFSIPHKGDYVYLAHHFQENDSTQHSDIVRIKLKGHKPALLLSGNIFDAYDSTYLTGVVKFIRTSDQSVVYEGTVDSLNKYEVKLLPGEVYEYIATSETYSEKSGKIDLTKLDHYEERTLDFYLEKPMLTLTGRIFNNKTKEAINGEIIFFEITGDDTLEIARQNVTPDKPYEIDLLGGKVYTYQVNAPNHIKPEYFEESQMIDLTNLEGRKKEQRDIYLNKLEVGTEWKIPNIYFAFDKSDLLSKSFESLNEVLKVMKEYPKLRVEIQGHTDSKGSDSYNTRLSDSRARSVRKYFIEKGIAPDRLESKGYGEKTPITTNETDEGRAQNRRVMLKVLAVK